MNSTPRLHDLREMAPRGLSVSVGPGHPAGQDPDQMVYNGFTQGGESFLKSESGPFGACHYDADQQCIFLARDAFGECPLHVLVAEHHIYVANRISRLIEAAGPDFNYDHVYAFPHGRWQHLKLLPRSVDVSSTHSFLGLPTALDEADSERRALSLDAVLRIAGTVVREAVRRRAEAWQGQRIAMLLSGGVDSFFVALLLRKAVPDLVAYTLTLDPETGDAAKATQFAQLLGMEHRVVRVDPDSVPEMFARAIHSAECYHLFNIYCAVAMLLIGQRLVDDGVRCAFCGEGMNEAVGDYRSWSVPSQRAQGEILMQKLDPDFISSVEGRERLVWGSGSFSGKLNRQLGAGLAKHATSRMVKPFLGLGLALECPYYEMDFMRRVVRLPARVIDQMGGKPRLLAKVFEDELREANVPVSLLDSCSKVRFQDGGDGGGPSITSALIEAGCDQGKAIEIFNERFGSTLSPKRDATRLGCYVS